MLADAVLKCFSYFSFYLKKKDNVFEPWKFINIPEDKKNYTNNKMCLFTITTLLGNSADNITNSWCFFLFFPENRLDISYKVSHLHEMFIFWGKNEKNFKCYIHKNFLPSMLSINFHWLSTLVWVAQLVQHLASDGEVVGTIPSWLSKIGTVGFFHLRSVLAKTARIACTTLISNKSH